MTTNTNRPNAITDEQVNKMHPRQAAILIEVPEEDRGAVLRSAHLMQNMTGGNLSGCLHSSVQEYRRIGVLALEARDNETNRRAMMR